MAAQRQERITILMPKEEAMRLRQYAKSTGFVIHSGKNVGEGSLTALLRALVRGEMSMTPDGISLQDDLRLRSEDDPEHIKTLGFLDLLEHRINELTTQYEGLAVEIKSIRDDVAQATEQK